MTSAPFKVDTSEISCDDGMLLIHVFAGEDNVDCRFERDSEGLKQNIYNTLKKKIYNKVGVKSINHVCLFHKCLYRKMI